jgi:putative N6-adenine-specific DNA methylase
VRQIDALAAKSPFGDMKKTGVIVFNPPYGERIELKGGRGDQNEDKKSRGARDPLPKNISDPQFVEFLANFGRHLKDQFDGWQMDVLTADMGLPGQLRMKETKRTPLFNGAIECRLFRFEIRKSFIKTTNDTIDSED